MALRLTFSGTDAAVLDRLRAKGSDIVDALALRLNELMLKLQAKIVSEKLHGQVLHQVSGKLAGSIHMIPATQDGAQIVGEVRGAGGPAFYGQYFEEGGKGPYTILPVNKKALRFYIDGKAIIRKRVTHPAIPLRPFMAPSLKEFTPDIVSGLQEALDEAAN